MGGLFEAGSGGEFGLMIFFQKSVDGRGGVRAVCRPLKYRNRRPGTLAGFFVPVASRWKSTVPGRRKLDLVGLFLAVRAVGFLLGAMETTHLKNRNNMKDLALPSEATMLQQTGWKRPFPHALCQDEKVLLQVKTFTFDLRNPDFGQYLYERTGMDHESADCGFDRALELLLCSDEAFRNTVRRSDGQPVKEADITGLLHTRQLEKARIQDCWELFIEKQAGNVDPEAENGLELWNMEAVV